jgi:predicted Zn-dependent protease
MKLFPSQPDYNRLAGECHTRLGQWQQAIDHLAIVVKARPKTAASWDALIQCLFAAGAHTEAEVQARHAWLATGEKPVFLFYQSAACFASGQTMNGLRLLEQAMEAAPKQLKRFMEVFPEALQHPALVDLLARFKRRRSF